MFELWLIVAILIMAIGSYVMGTLDWDNDQKIGVFWCIAIAALVWPLLLAFTIILGPFVGLFWLGNRRRRKPNEPLKINK